MGRKKKNDDEDIFVHPFPTIQSEILDVTRLNDSRNYTSYIGSSYTIYPIVDTTGIHSSDHVVFEPRYFDARDILGRSVDTTTVSGDIPSLSSIMSWEDYTKQMGRKEEAEVNLISRDYPGGEHAVVCNTASDLLPEKILTTISAAKGKLMFTIAPVHIKEIQCKMTPDVRNSIMEASKKLKMYGKKSPIIPSFDEYGNRLPDQIEIGNSKGIVVQIIDPRDVGRKIVFRITSI